MDSQGVFCPNLACPARGQSDQGNIRVHSQRTQSYRCQVCGQTFTARKGTAFYRLHWPAPLFVQVVTLLAYGCPPTTIVAAFRTLEQRVKTLEAERNATRCTIHWQFTSQQARTKLVDLYPIKEA